MCVQGRWRREPARAKTSQSSCLQRLAVLLPSQVCQAAGKLPHTAQPRGKEIQGDVIWSMGSDAHAPGMSAAQQRATQL